VRRSPGFSRTKEEEMLHTKRRWGIARCEDAGELVVVGREGEAHGVARHDPYRASRVEKQGHQQQEGEKAGVSFSIGIVG